MVVNSYSSRRPVVPGGPVGGYEQFDKLHRYFGIEGTRGWLAWIVVFAHIEELTFIGQHIRGVGWLYGLSIQCVYLFIIVSGFVITNLILVKNERYLFYIFRRFMRIYPIYLICLAFGVLLSAHFYYLLSHNPWPKDIVVPSDTLLEARSIEGGSFLAQLLCHITLIQGAIPNNVLYNSQFAFLPPAWSLSLEWQFYLLAPILINGLGRPRLDFTSPGLRLQPALPGSAMLSVHSGFRVFCPAQLGSLRSESGTRFALDEPNSGGQNLGLVLALLVAIASFQLSYCVWILVVLYMSSYNAKGGFNEMI